VATENTVSNITCIGAAGTFLFAIIAKKQLYMLQYFDILPYNTMLPNKFAQVVTLLTCIWGGSQL
jgi:hypothetical protein